MIPKIKYLSEWPVIQFVPIVTTGFWNDVHFASRKSTIKSRIQKPVKHVCSHYKRIAHQKMTTPLTTKNICSKRMTQGGSFVLHASGNGRNVPTVNKFTIPISTRVPVQNQNKVHPAKKKVKAIQKENIESGTVSIVKRPRKRKIVTKPKMKIPLDKLLNANAQTIDMTSAQSGANVVIADTAIPIENNIIE